MNVKLFLENKLQKTVISLWPKLKGQALAVAVDYPPDAKFGDYTCSLSMKLAPLAHKNPMETAEAIRQALGRIPALSEIRVVAPGFLNFYLDQTWLNKQIKVILLEKNKFGQGALGQGQRLQVEFVSVNPTGPLHVGHGRGAFAGDALANILKLAGWRVQKEYYVNNVGKQVGILAESVLRRYWQHQGIRIEFPDYCYQGKYVEDLAKELFLPNYKLGNLQKLEEVRDKIKGRILQKMIGNIKKFLEKKLGLQYDKWFYENTLYETGAVDRIMRGFKEKGLLYKSEGAIWLKTSQFGDDKDRVLIKADQEPVYFLSDIAYHWDKLAKRKFDKVIDIWGADHHGYIGRMQAAMNILGFSGKLDIIITQLVRLMSRGQEIRMSKRSGNIVSLEELVDEVGVDAARFFFLMHDFSTHMDFDLDLAKQKSKKNPVYYVQYAHARICSIIRKAKNLSLVRQLGPLEIAEANLLKTLIKWPELVAEVAQDYGVNKLPTYAVEVAMNFHDFYTQCRVISGQQVNENRLNLLKASQIVLKNILSAMGISAPEQM